MPAFGLLDVLGLIGVAMMLVGYGLTITGRIDAKRPLALSLNLVGALLVLASLSRAFNLSAVVIEAAWALIAAYGLARHWLGRRA